MSEHEDATMTTPVLPLGWRWVRLDDVCTLNPRRPPIARAPDAPTTFVQMSAVEEDGKGIAAAEVRPFHEVQKGYTYFGEGDVLFAKITPCMQNGKSAVAHRLIDGFGFGSTEFHVIRPGDAVLAEWVHAFLVQPWVLTQAMNHFTGAVGQQRVPASYLASLHIPLPPLDAQRYIADTLTKQMGAVEQARAASYAQLAAVKQLMMSYMNTVFNEHNLSEWPHVKLIEVANKITDGTHQPPAFSQSGVPFLFVGNIAKGLLDFSVTNYVSQKTYNSLTARWRVEQGDVLFSAVGSFGVAVVVNTDRPFTFQRHIAIIKPRRDIINPRFLSHYLNSPGGYSQSDAAALGGAQRTVTLASLARFDIPLPPIEQQNEVVAFLDAATAKIATLHAASQQRQQEIARLPAALLKQAFTGALSARRQPTPAPETLDGKRERMAAIIALLLEECRQRGHVLGRTVASKGLYLAAVHAEVPLGVPFRRWQYGPYFNGIREVETYAEERGWFTNHSRQWGIEYVPGGAFADALAFAPGLLHGRASAMHEIAALLAGLNADGAEAVGTLYAAWNDFLLDDVRPDDATIIREVRENWHAEKAKIPVQTWEHWLHWMHEHELTPRGTEPHTIHTMRGRRG